MTVKERLHRLVESLPEGAAPTVEAFMEFVIARSRQQQWDDPVLQAFMEAPEDDEPLTPEDIEAIEEGHADVARGDVVPWSTYLKNRRTGS